MGTRRYKRGRTANSIVFANIRSFQLHPKALGEGSIVFGSSMVRVAVKGDCALANRPLVGGAHCLLSGYLPASGRVLNTHCGEGERPRRIHPDTRQYWCSSGLRDPISTLAMKGGSGTDVRQVL